jgi:hypothetical protein
MTLIHPVMPVTAWSLMLSLILLCTVVILPRLSARAQRLLGGVSVAVALVIAGLAARAVSVCVVPYNCCSDPWWLCVMFLVCECPCPY